MSKKALIPDILLKLSNIYKEDMYFINSMYCIGGITSDDSAIGKSFCILEKERADDIRDYFGNLPVIYIKNLKKAKEFYSTEFEYQYVQAQVEEKLKKELIEKKDEYLSIINSTKKWNQFHFTDDEVKALIKDNERITLFTNDKDIPSLEVTKCVFPMITEKGLNNLMYTVGKTKNVKNAYTLITNMNHDYFQIYNFIRYIRIDKQ